jgi:hypothetical protein
MMSPKSARLSSCGQRGERVYDALTQAAELDAPVTSGAKVDPRAGGEMRRRCVSLLSRPFSLPGS